MEVHHWNVYCQTGHCKWHQFYVKTKVEAETCGDEHIETRHADADRWKFRLVGIAMKSNATVKSDATIDVFSELTT